MYLMIVFVVFENVAQQFAMLKARIARNVLMPTW